MPSTSRDSSTSSAHPNAIERLFRADLTQRPPSTARKSFAAFKTVVEQYPKSEYAHDSLQRMVYLRDRLASYEVHVARYYYKRGPTSPRRSAPRAPSSSTTAPRRYARRSQILIQCYDKLNLEPLAAQTRQVYAANYSSDVRTAQAEVKKSWWRFW